MEKLDSVLIILAKQAEEIKYMVNSQNLTIMALAVSQNFDKKNLKKNEHFAKKALSKYLRYYKTSIADISHLKSLEMVFKGLLIKQNEEEKLESSSTEEMSHKDLMVIAQKLEAKKKYLSMLKELRDKKLEIDEVKIQ